jgi:hypothetical protein
LQSPKKARIQGLSHGCLARRTPFICVLIFIIQPATIPLSFCHPSTTRPYPA